MTRTARLALLASLLVGCSTGPAPSDAPASAPQEPGPTASEADGRELGGQVAYVAGADPQIHLLDLATGESRQLTELRPEHAELADAGPLRPVLTCGFGPSSLAWSPDGAMLAFSYGGCEGVLYIVDLDGELTRVADGRAPAWSPDGRHLVFSPNIPFCMGGPECGQEPLPGAWSLQVVDIPLSGDPRPLSLHEHARMAGQPSFSADGGLIAFSGPITDPEPGSSAFNATYVMRADGGEPRLIGRGVWPQGWLPDGRLLIVQEESGDLFALDPESGDSAGLGGDAGMAPVAPDGTRLLLNEMDPQSGANTARLVTLEGDVLAEGAGYPAAWAADSRAALIVGSAMTELIVLDRDGAELGRLPLAQAANGVNAAWRPGT